MEIIYNKYSQIDLEVTIDVVYLTINIVFMSEVVDWLKKHPLIKIGSICKQTGIDPANFHRMLHVKREIPAELLGKIIPIIKEYGYKESSAPIPAPKTEKPAETTQKKEEAPKGAENESTKIVGIGVVKSAKYFDTLIRESSDKSVLESLKEDLAANEIIPADQKKGFNTRIEFKLKRL